MGGIFSLATLRKIEMSWKRMRRKGKGKVLIPLLLITVLLGAYGLYHLFTTYPTGYEVATKFDGAQYNAYTFPYVVETDYPDSQTPDLTASTVWYDPDVRDRGFPDAWAQIGQPMHVKYSNDQYIPCDYSEYTERWERLFWSSDEQTVVKHTVDIHHFILPQTLSRRP